MNSDEPFFLFVGTVTSEAATSKLKTFGTSYKRKMLESSPDNWKSIELILDDPALAGVVLKLTSSTTTSLNHEMYKELGEKIFRRISQLPHVVVVHEGVLSEEMSQGKTWESILGEDEPSDEDLEWIGKYYFRPPSEEARENLRNLVQEYDINLMPYMTNAEVSVITSNFIQDYDKKLLFRVYVPIRRMGASEADKLVSLFREWLSRFKGQRVRQDGYSTGHGRVYEFYSDGAAGADDLTAEIRQFSDFLELCSEKPDVALDLLRTSGLDAVEAGRLIGRFALESRRLNADLKYERESRILALRYNLETEIIELGGRSDGVSQLVQEAVPGVSEILASAFNLNARRQITESDGVSVSQHFIERATGMIAHQVSGTSELGSGAKHMLDVVSRYAGSGAVSMQTAVLEFEDEDAPKNERLAARKKLQGFLFKVGHKSDEFALAQACSYIEGKKC